MEWMFQGGMAKIWGQWIDGSPTKNAEPPTLQSATPDLREETHYLPEKRKPAGELIPNFEF
jgi:hypothetical protein